MAKYFALKELKTYQLKLIKNPRVSDKVKDLKSPLTLSDLIRLFPTTITFIMPSFIKNNLDYYVDITFLTQSVNLIIYFV